MFYLSLFLALTVPSLLKSADINLGQIFQPEERYFTITATNTHRDPLVLKRLILTCPCFSGEMKEITLGPGESASLKIKFLSLEMDPGTLDKEIFILTDKGRLMFRVAVEIIEKKKKVLIYSGITFVGRFKKSGSWNLKFEELLLEMIGKEKNYRWIFVRAREERDSWDLMKWLKDQQPFICSAELFNMTDGYQLNLRIFSPAGEIISTRVFKGRKAEKLMKEAAEETVRSVSQFQ